MKNSSEDFKHFITHLRFESVALAVLMIVLTYKSTYSLWWILIGFPFIDICMVGYLFGPKSGALAYNLIHNATIPTLLISIGVLTSNGILSVIGYVWVFHSAFDRILGYGLKHKHSFNETHMGKIIKS